MHQRLSALTILMLCLGTSLGKDPKSFRLPTISNSLVNLGKMDITLNFGPPSNIDNGQSSTKQEIVHSASPFLVPKSESQVELENCPCSSIKNFKNPFLNSPTDFINQILRSNDLFSVNQEPLLSSMCCDSHEQEDTVFFDFSPKNILESSASITNFANPAASAALPSFSFLDSFLPKIPMSSPIGAKPKAIEIFFFPKNKNGKIDFDKITNDAKIKRNEIQIVGDKELRNDFKNYKYRPTFPILQKKESRVGIEAELEKARHTLKKQVMKLVQEKNKEVKKSQEQFTTETTTPKITESTTSTASTVKQSNAL